MSLSVGSCSSNSCFPNIQILNYCTEGTTVYFNFSITSTLHRSWLTFLLLFSSLVSLRCPCLSLLVTHPLVNNIYVYIQSFNSKSWHFATQQLNFIQYRLHYVPKQLSLMYTSMYALVTFLMAMLSWYVYVCCGVGRSLKGYMMCMAMVANGYLHLHHYPQSYFQWHLS